ncbi:FAD/FMN-containing dehydrogenase [Pseudomonas sp. gcc21]|uniref:FAD/FMN-containing dehydrogenase n=1 Tax=Pseudomonas sp. gcc21 TaxID=2726989 RepID=UPI0014510A56|nr:FAD/FMN-containing dehydrogenase [Pseudomonas sp. gcc21]QJD58906.1 FAD/FMN-containing dehydrogenase [Pseudomonas sp. gcc21]
MKPLFFALSLLLMPFAQADEPATPATDRIEPWTLPDQFDEPYTFEPDERVMLIAASNGAAGLVNDAIKDQPEGWLAQRSVIYVADITRVPKFVANRVLIPSMRSAAYRILLDREDQVASRYVTERSEVLWLGLEDSRIIERRRFDSAPALRLALEALDPINDTDAAAQPGSVDADR